MLKLQEKYDNFAASFYDWWSALAGRISKLFRLTLFSSWLNRHFKKPAAIVGLESFVALTLVIYYFFLLLSGTSEKPLDLDNTYFNAEMFTYLSHYPVADTKKTFLDGYPDWKTRLPGPIITGWMTDKAMDFCIRRNLEPKSCSFGIGAWRYNVYKCTFGFYHAAWLLALFCLLIYYRTDALLIMLGTFAGLMLNVSIVGQRFFTPWDLPTMFFFTWAIIIYDNSRRMLPLATVICLGALFRETTMICALLILLGEHWPQRQRIIGFVSTVIVYLATKKLLLVAYAVHIATFSWDNFQSGLRLGVNFELTFIRHELNNPFFANAGALLIMLLLPWRTYRDKLFKLIAGTFIVSIVCFGVVTEFRVWYELLPLGWMMLSEAISNRYPTIQKSQTGLAGLPNPSVVDERTSRAMKGSYCLIMGTLLVVVLGLLAVGNFISARPVADKPSNPSASQKLIASAREGNVEAQYNLGRIYQNGIGVKPNTTEAADWYQRAAKQGNSEAQNNLGMLLVADQRDYVAAAQWFAMAAKQGNADAEYNLGAIYYRGMGTNYEFAAHWFEEAALQGHVPAQKNLGKMYQLGQGVKQDYIEAYKWLKLAQLRGDKDAENELKACSASMTLDQISDAEKQVQEMQLPGR